MTAPSICQGNHTCDKRTPHICYNKTDWTVIGYNTHDLDLPLFKVLSKDGTKVVQDAIAADQAMSRPHIIYTVVRTADLWW